MKKLKRIILIILAGYLFINTFLFFNQKNMLYFPDKTDFLKCNNFEENEKKTYSNNKKEIFLSHSTRFYEVAGEKNNVIIFFHGNAGRACDRMGILSILKKTGNTIIFVEYDGYADKNETPNIKNILKNVKAIGSYVKIKNFDKVYVMGRSLGTGPASYFAGNFKTDKLLLVSAYDELYKVAAEKYPIFPVKYLFTQNFESLNYLKDYKKDFLLIHGKKDKVIPYKHGEYLYNKVTSENKNFISLEKANHHNVFDSENISEEIVKYFNYK